jgi:3'(2'), 5'-bisphosphate nucleotidase
MTAPLQAELDFVKELVQRCGEIALRYQAGGPRILGVRHKPMGGGPITEADKEINDHIVTALTSRFPGDGILAEESPEDESWRTAERCWHVDPIDGTREFARGSAGWTVQVGLCIDGHPVLGVVGEPGHGRLSWATIVGDDVVHGQVWGDGSPKPLHVSDRPLSELRLIGGKLFPFSRQHAIRRALDVPGARASSVGSVGVRITSIARGEADAYVQAPGKTKMWDTCGPAALLMAAGGRITDLRGDPLRFRGTTVTHPTGVVATHGHDHEAILAKLAPLVDAWLPSR